MKHKLQLFCDPGVYLDRYLNLDKPFRHGPWLYATDGAIIVRVPADDEKEAVVGVPDPDRVAAIYSNFDAAKCTKPWPRGDANIGIDRISANRLELSGCQILGNRGIKGIYWLIISLLGDVFYNPDGGKGCGIQFVCNELQGVVNPVAESVAELRTLKV